jgi:D-amino-acid dehydrogenase
VTPPRRVVVVGAGVAGLFCAYYLRKRDVDVVVVDATTVGSRAASSWGNGGWICPAQAGPLPEPGLTAYGLRALFDPDSALYFKPSYLPRVAPWLLRFRSYCNARAFDAGTAALAQLGKEVFTLVDDLVADGAEFELYKLGAVCAAGDAASAQKVLTSLQAMKRFGFDLPDTLLGEDELHELEPALSSRVRAGFLIPEQWHVKPETFTTGVAAILRRDGVEIVENAPVSGFDVADGKIRAVLTPKGDFAGDAVVLAAGSWTQPLAGKLGVHFPMQPGKGYSFLIRPKIMPRHGILFSDIHAGATPLGDRLRIGGTMEFSGYNTTVDHRRIDTVFRLAREYLNELESPDVEEPWAGMRPITADGLPVLDRAEPYSNAYLATGYSMLGMTVSEPGGKALAELILTGERPAVLEPFRLDRFRRGTPSGASAAAG